MRRSSSAAKRAVRNGSRSRSRSCRRRSAIGSDAPPDAGELYRVAEFKRRLTHDGIEGGYAAFLAAYPSPSLRVGRFPLRRALEIARETATYRELDAADVPFVARAPRTYGTTDAHDFVGRSRAFFVASFDDALVMGRSSVVRVDGAALLDFQGDERARGDDRLELDAALFAVEGDVAHVIEPTDGPALDLDEAFVSLLAPQSDAFGHWLWHQLPRFVAAIEARAIPETIPVLVDAAMPPSHLDALRLAIGDRTMPIVTIERGELVRVARAWYASTPFYLPHLPVANDAWTWAHMATPPARWLPILAAMARTADAFDGEGGGDRIYLARKPHLRRRLTNAAEIETRARELGFTIAFPEELAFADQLRLVRDARCIAGPEGSAMFLTFYARPGLRLTILDHPFTAQLTNYTAALEERGDDVAVVTGDVVAANDGAGYPNFGFRHFADYRIDPDPFARAVERDPP